MPIIRLLELVSANQLLVSWREPARCCYPEQIWVQTIARRACTCVLTGDHIAQGDLAYTPTGNPLNAGETISPRSLGLLDPSIEYER